MSFTQINLANIPAPAIVEALDFESIFASMLADLQARDPAFTALVESDPAYKILEVAAYRELLIRQRINDAAHGVMLAYAVGSDLDNLAANFNVQRLLITPANDSAIPPVPAVYESDEDFRKRTQLAWEGLSTAGPVGAYIYHGLSAHPDVADIAVEAVEFHVSSGSIVIDYAAHLAAPEPGMVAITVLSRVEPGTPSTEVLDAVTAALNSQHVRPLNDRVIVRPVAMYGYAVEATLYFYDGPSSDTVLQAAQAAVEDYVANHKKIGYDITRSGLFAALHQPGVQNVVLTNPATDQVADTHQALFCMGITLMNGGVSV